jgi:hypothetical protein
MTIAAEGTTRRTRANEYWRHAGEIALVALAFLLYFLVRGAVVDDPRAALDNAYDIIDLEYSLGIFWEPRLQDMIIDNRIAVQAMNFVYFWLDFPLIVAVGLWMYFRGHRHEYTVARDAMLLSGAIALVFYWLYPVMPPRLLPGDVFVGTIERYSDLSYQASSTQAFVNPYAAVPSLHFGWAMILGGAIVVTWRHPLAIVIGLSLPWLQLAAIVFTGNHYILDAFAGLLVCLAGVLLALAAQRWLYPRFSKWEARRQQPEPRTVAA